MKPRILLLSGTSEGRLLARALLDRGAAVTATVTRDEAVENLFGPLAAEMTVQKRGFSAESLADYLRRGEAGSGRSTPRIRLQRASRRSPERSAEAGGAPYVRYERPESSRRRWRRI